MKRVEIDGDLCQGTGECAAIAPGVVSFDAGGVAQIGPGRDLLPDEVADRLIATCPSMAVTAYPA